VNILAYLAAPVLVASIGVGVATPMKIEGDVGGGTIVCSEGGHYSACTAAYSPHMVGVISDTPLVSFKNDEEGQYPVLVTGKTEVAVTNKNGEIKKGDYITSSDIAGIGQLADKSGYILGIALGNASFDENGLGQVGVNIEVKPAVLTVGAGNNLLRLIREGIDASFLSPLSALRYLLAAFIVGFSIIAGISFFGRVARSGIWAIGRNPKASRSISLGIVFNVILTLLIMAAGVVAAYVVLVI